MDDVGKANDVLLTALHLAVGVWNADHGLAGSGRVGVLAPANLRPSEWRDEIVGNFCLPARISSNPNQRVTPTRAATVTAQTSRKKKSGIGTGFVEILSRSWLLPLWATTGVIGTIDALGHRFADTAVLWNLGHVGDAPSFGADSQFCADAARRFVDSYVTQLHLVLDSVADASPSLGQGTSEPRATVTELHWPEECRP